VKRNNRHAKLTHAPSFLTIIKVEHRHAEKADSLLMTKSLLVGYYDYMFQ